MCELGVGLAPSARQRGGMVVRGAYQRARHCSKGISQLAVAPPPKPFAPCQPIYEEQLPQRNQSAVPVDNPKLQDCIDLDSASARGFLSPPPFTGHFS